MNDAKAVASDVYTEDYYAELCGGAEFFRLYGPKVVKPSMAYALKRARLKPGMAVLDMGCGRGEVLYQAKGQGAFAAGADYAQAALKVAAKSSQAPVLRCDAKRLPFAEKTFDRIFFLGVVDHLHDWELQECFGEFRRVLKPGGLVLATTCTNTDYYKNRTYAWRKTWARLLGLPEPSPPRSGHDEEMHINEHSQGVLEAFFRDLGWDAEVEPRPNEKYYCLEELYGKTLPQGFPMRGASGWKRAWHAAAFRGPWKRLLARELFCSLTPGSSKELI